MTTIYGIRLLVAVALLLGIAMSEPLAGAETAHDESSRKPRQIALSMDDAPMGQGFLLSGVERSALLLEKLKSRDIPQVVFFCVTERLGYHSGHARLTAYAEAGHLLANHTHSHPSLSRVGATAFLKDVREAHDSLVQFSTFIPWFRYPMLDEGRTRPLRDSVRFALESLGYRNGYVTVDTWDWYVNMRLSRATKDGRSIDTTQLGELYVDVLSSAVEFYDSLSIETLGRSVRHVLLLHENDLAALYIDRLIDRLRQDGWEFISPEEAYRDPEAGVIPDVLINNQGRIVAHAVASGLPDGIRHETESAAYLDSLLAERGIISP